jgi:hypothetical protein
MIVYIYKNQWIWRDGLVLSELARSRGNLVSVLTPPRAGRGGLDYIKKKKGSTLDIEDAVQRTCGSASDMNITELAYHHLSYVGKSPMPRVQPCEGSSPVLANAWTDGSYRNPGKCLAVRSFGVWHPTRDPGDLRPEECDFAAPIPQAIHGQPKGLMLAGVLPGVFNSSTRTELAAFIAICASPFPLKIALTMTQWCSARTRSRVGRCAGEGTGAFSLTETFGKLPKSASASEGRKPRGAPGTRVMRLGANSLAVRSSPAMPLTMA